MNRRIVLLILASVLLSLVSKVNAQRQYHLEHEWVEILINQDGTIDLFYNISITLDSGPNIDYVIIGQPKRDFTIGEARDQYGHTLSASDSSSAGNYKVRINLYSPLGAGQTVWFTVITNVARMIYEDAQNPGNVGMHFTPTWWSEATVLDLRVSIVLPSGVKSTMIKTSVEWDDVFTEPSGRLTVFWERQNLEPGQRYNFQISYPKAFQQNYVGLQGEQALINPVPGQYANYSIEYYENEVTAFSGWWNFSYLEYVEPNLVNVTLDYDGSELYGVDGDRRYYHDIGWLTIDITNRWVVESSVWGMVGSWYDFWIETNVTEGSVIRIERTNGTVVRSQAIKLAAGFVDCWVVNLTTERPSDSWTSFYDKKTGLCTMEYLSIDRSEYGGTAFGARLALVSTDIPIGAYFPMHELGISLEAATTLRPNESASVVATVHNYGLSNETDIEIQLLIDGTIVNSTLVPFVENGSSAELNYMWTPLSDGAYNVTAYVKPVPGEALLENNQITLRSRVRYEAKMGVQAGGWIIYNYTIIGAPSGTVLPQWMKLEFLSVEGTRASVLATMRMSDGTMQSQTLTMDVVTGDGTPATLTGFVIPANSTTGDSIYISGYGDVLIVGETTWEYAGANRTVVFASWTQQDPFTMALNYCWDKQTGVLVEVDEMSTGLTAIAMVTETNLWQAQMPSMLGDVNWDNRVDIMDLAAAGLAFASYPGHPRWNRLADINRDGKVDILDLAMIAKNLGKAL